MIRILVDSSADIDTKNRKEISLIPLTVTIGGRDYLDGVDLDKNEFYDLLVGGNEFPKTSQPTPQAFVEIFEEVKNKGDELIYFSISSELSGTYQSALIAKGMVDYNEIYIIDTKSVSHGIALLAEYAEKLRKEGFKAAEIAEKTEILRNKIRIIAGVDTLQYLYKGGRLSRGAATVGEMAGIKPIIEVTEGKVEVIGKTLGKGKAIQSIIKSLSNIERDKDFPLYFVFTYGEENCVELEEKLRQTDYNDGERRQIGSAIGAHVGPGAYGVIFIEK
ncbi:MAG: DegV family protein [Clostridia bacterium]|nr:DegV family protein [Clostridia bacterium]